MLPCSIAVPDIYIQFIGPIYLKLIIDAAMLQFGDVLLYQYMESTNINFARMILVVIDNITYS